MPLPMTYLERKMRGDTTLVIVDGRIYEPDYMEQDMTNILELGSTKTALIDGPSVARLEDLWEITYKKDLDSFMDEQLKNISTQKVKKGTKLGDEIIKTELQYFIVFKVFRNFVSDISKLSRALSKIKTEYKEQEEGIQSNIKKHMRGQIDDATIERYSRDLLKEEPEKKGSSLAEKLAKRLGNFNEETDAPQESVPEISEEKEKESVFSTTFDYNMLVIDDLVFWIEKARKNESIMKVNGTYYAPAKTPLMQAQDLIAIYMQNLEKKFKDAAFFSQPRLRKLLEMQMLIEEELKRDVYKQKRLEIAETGRPDAMYAIMGFDEFVNRGQDGNYFLFPPGQIAVLVEWRDGKVGNSNPVIWGDYYAPNISNNGKHLTSLCLAGYNNENKRMSREAKIADYLAHSVRTMQHGYIPGSVTVYNDLRANNPKFNKLRISKQEMEKRGLRSLNIE